MIGYAAHGRPCVVRPRRPRHEQGERPDLHRVTVGTRRGVEVGVEVGHRSRNSRVWSHAGDYTSRGLPGRRPGRTGCYRRRQGDEHAHGMERKSRMNQDFSQPAVRMYEYSTDAAADTVLYCFSHACGAAPFYRRWAACLPPRVALCAIQQSARQDMMRFPPFSDMAALACATAQAIADNLRGRRYAFFGHSMGALTAFETARRLRQAWRHGTRPAGCFRVLRAAPEKRSAKGAWPHRRAAAGAVGGTRRA